jgi:recombination associated protein RdgC
MWFKNALIYQVEEMPEFDALEAGLSEHEIKPCPPHSRFIYGWVNALNQQKTYYANGAALFVMGKEERILPTSVINQILQAKVEEIEEREGRTLRRSERNQIKEELEFTLLPKSFSILKKTWAYFDKQQKRLIINTSSQTVAAQFCSLLRKSFQSLSLTPLTLDIDLSGRLTQCITTPHHMPDHLDLGQRVVLQAPDDEGKRFTCKGYELPADEVLDLLSRGLEATELAFQFNERLDFTLTNQFVFKNIKCRDLLLDELKETQHAETKEEEFDASFMLMVGELNQLLDGMTQFLESMLDSFLPEKTAIESLPLQSNVSN